MFLNRYFLRELRSTCMGLHIYQSTDLSQLAVVFCTGRRMGLVGEAFFHMDHVSCNMDNEKCTL